MTRRGSGRRGAAGGPCRGLVLLALLAAAVPAVARSTSGSVAGRVSDRQGRAVAGARVTLAAIAAETATGADGRFALEDLPPGVYRLQAGAAGFTVDSREVTVEAGAVTRVELTLVAVAIPLDEVVVTSSFTLLSDQPIARVNLSRDEIVALPHFGDDLYRAIQVLPGVSSGDFSAAFSVRGGLHDELLVRLDGHELFEPFHLRDFQGVFSALDPEVVGGVELLPGGFPAEFGDRVSGVLDMTSRAPRGRRGSLGISFSNAWANGGGRFGGGRGRWLVSGRRGYLDVLLNFVGGDDEEEEGDADPDPRYWDGFAMLDWSLGDRQTLAAKLHVSDDDLLFEEQEPDEITEAITSYGSTLLGLNWTAMLDGSGLVETLLAANGVSRDRDIESIENGESTRILDDRDTEILTLRQDWSWQLGDRQYWKWGFEARRFETDYDYFNTFAFRDPIDDPRFLPSSGLTRFAGSFRGEHYSLYAADRMRLAEGWTLELGGRWDRQTLTDDDQVSPRVNLVVDLERRSLLRAGWGHFFQSQRPYELDVEFGETEFSPAQRAVHWTLGWEKLLAAGYTMRVDAYRREVDNPRSRFETLFDPLSPVPEVEEDRIRIDARRVEASGVELFARAPAGRKLGWWVSYVWSEIVDRVDGRDQLRSIDQTHALTWNSHFRPSPKWELNWVWTWHTGWPTTAITGEAVGDADGRLQLRETVGPFYGERLDDYHRLDLRTSRRTRLRRGQLVLFIDIQNLYDRGNIRGLDLDDIELRRQPDGRLLADYAEVEWLGVVPSFGVSWEF